MADSLYGIMVRLAPGIVQRSSGLWNKGRFKSYWPGLPILLLRGTFEAFARLREASMSRTRAAAFTAALLLAPAPAFACDFGPWDVSFASGSSSLSEEARGSAGAAKVLLPLFEREGIVASIKITASAERPGSDGMRLPRRRVEAVRKYLLDLGVPPARIYATVTSMPAVRIRSVAAPRLSSAPVTMVAFPAAVRTVRIELTRGCGG